MVTTRMFLPELRVGSVENEDAWRAKQAGNSPTMARLSIDTLANVLTMQDTYSIRNRNGQGLP